MGGAESALEFKVTIRYEPQQFPQTVSSTAAAFCARGEGPVR